MTRDNYDIVIIGGGFYGCVLALHLKKSTNKILLIEKEKELLLKASYNNQARIHNGYHYPRSFLTALRSHANYGRFIKDYRKTVYDSFKQYYAIASNFSKTTGQQFFKFANQLGSPIKEAPDNIKKLFNPSLIENVFEVEEAVYDAGLMRDKLLEDLKKKGVSVIYNSEVNKVWKDKEGGLLITLLKSGRKYRSKAIYNCTYSAINEILERSQLPLLPFKQEFTEMPLIEVPEELKNLSISVFDGPFFGFLPFPDKKCHSLWHVRYAIRATWVDPADENITKKLNQIAKKSNYSFMVKDVCRYLPAFANAKYLGSLYETKTVLTEKEENDARPILLKKNYGFGNFSVVMGGKIDNIYDVLASE